MNELLSVIIPVYNSDKYLNRCLYSVSKQSYTNLEIIIVDDGATDNSAEIIDSFCKKDNRFHRYHNKNEGQSAARNFALEKATGSLIAFLDSDDFIDSDMYLTLIRNLNGSDSDISICGYYKYVESAHKGVSPKHDDKVTIYTKDEALERLYTSEIESYVWNKIYKRELFTDVKFPVNKNHEDIYIMYRLFNKANKIVYQDTPKYYFVQRENALAYNKTDKNCIDYLNGLISRYKAVSDGVDIEVKKKILANIYSEYVDQSSKENKEDTLFFVKNFLLIENLDFRPYLSSLKHKQLSLRRLGIKYHNQFKIINLIKH